MSPDAASGRRDLLTLAADGCLLTAGAFALMMGVAFGLDALGAVPLAEPRGSGVGVLLSVISCMPG